MTNQGLEIINMQPTPYTLSNDSIIDVLSSLQMCFELVPERWILRHVQYSEVDHWIRYKD